VKKRLSRLFAPFTAALVSTMFASTAAQAADKPVVVREGAELEVDASKLKAYSSSDAKILGIRIDSKRHVLVVHGKAVGTAKLLLQYEDGRDDTLIVTVKP
jgi:hypothetical protein